jgi:guanylate kinase
VTPPSFEKLRQRLADRGTEDLNVMHERLCRAGEECQGIDAYDYLIVNDELEACVDQVHSILQNEHAKIFRNKPFFDKIKSELEAYVKGE